MDNSLERRDFVKGVLSGAVGLGLMGTGSRTASAAEVDNNSSGGIPLRMLGKTGLKVTMLAAPGWHIGRMKEEKNAIRMLRMAKDLGINFFDSAWSYENGASEIRNGKAFKDDRTDVLLMSKVAARDAKGAAEQLHESLTRLQTDYLDLWQFHNVTTVEEVEQIFGPGGAYEVAEKAKRDGKVRHIGLTDHRDPAVLLKVMREYGDLIETFQMPVNVIDPHYESFITQVIPEAVKRNIGVIAMKTCSIGLIAENRIATIDECLNYVWSLPVSVVVSGMDHYDHLNHNAGLARNFTPMSEQEISTLLARTSGKFGPDYERYKLGNTKPWRVFPEEPML